MLILAIDTALDACAAGVLDTDAGRLIAHESQAMKRGHAEALVPLIARIIKASGIELPPSPASVIEIDFKAEKIKPQDWALGALAVLAKQNKVLTLDMLKAALKLRFRKAEYETAIAMVEKAAALQAPRL